MQGEGESGWLPLISLPPDIGRGGGDPLIPTLPHQLPYGENWMGGVTGSRCLCAALLIHSLRLADPAPASPSRLSSICGDVTRAIGGVRCSTGGIMGVLVKWGICERSQMKSVRRHIFLHNTQSYSINVHCNTCAQECLYSSGVCTSANKQVGWIKWRKTFYSRALLCLTRVLHWLSRIRSASRRPNAPNHRWILSSSRAPSFGAQSISMLAIYSEIKD